MITYDDVLIFLEIKDRKSAGWIGEAINQLINTIELFKSNSVIEKYNKLYGYISNKQRPHFKSSGIKFSQEFEEKTGFILRISDVIKIQ